MKQEQIKKGEQKPKPKPEPEQDTRTPQREGPAMIAVQQDYATHQFLGSPTATMWVSTAAGCIRFVGTARCGQGKEARIHQVVHVPPDCAFCRGVANSSMCFRKADCERAGCPCGPGWDNMYAFSTVPVPQFARHERHGGPAPELGMLLHGQVYRRGRPTSPAERRRSLEWLECERCFGPSQSVTGDGRKVCRDCCEATTEKETQ